MSTPEPVIAFIGLGSNLGDRLQALRRAVTMLGPAAAPAGAIVVSSLYETAPLGGPPGQPLFLNAVARLPTPLGPRGLLGVLLGIEADLGRTRTARNASRTIDLDLLLYGQGRLDEPGLVVPHPELARRRFVLEPLAELAPTLRHPVLGDTIQDLADHARLQTAQAVRRIQDHQWVHDAPMSAQARRHSPVTLE